MSDLIKSAHAFALNAHGDQRRYTGDPYIIHPAEVARLVACAEFDEEVVAAAWLHDVVEDCGVAVADLVIKFGPRVADIVFQVTDISKPEDGGREMRKELDRQKMAKADYFGKSLKLADLIDNTSTIVKHNPGFARKRYLREKAALLEVLTDGHPGLLAKAMVSLENAKRELKIDIQGENDERP